MTSLKKVNGVEIESLSSALAGWSMRLHHSVSASIVQNRRQLGGMKIFVDSA